MTNPDHRLISNYAVYEVRFAVRSRDSSTILYTAVVHVIAAGNSPALYRTAEDAARSWGAFQDPDESMAFDHHLYERTFEPISAAAIAQVDGITVTDAAFLVSTDPKANWD